MRTTFILDTCVLVYDPQAYKSFPGNDVVIPINVLDELDKLKSSPNDAGKNARLCIRALDALCSQGEIHKGIKIEDDILLKIDTSTYVNNFGPDSYIDNKILACAFNLSKSTKPKKHAVLVSRDINLRIRARAYEIKSEDYEKEKMQFSDLYTGHRELDLEVLGTRITESTLVESKEFRTIKDLFPNECVAVDTLEGKQVLARKVKNGLRRVQSRRPWSLDLRNKEQAFACDLLCDPDVPLVTLIGRAGTGKTLCAVASALEMVLEKKVYNKLIIYRPIQAVGSDIGYLPGSMEEKLAPWMGAITDSFEFLFEAKNGNRWRAAMDLYKDKGMIQMEAITYIRGRSIPDAFIIVDEAQNLTKDEVKTILTRASDGTKIVLTGDIEQIDNSSLDATNNGLSYVVERFKDSELAGHVTFTKGERSALASRASEIL